jgi:hypothetical protein
MGACLGGIRAHFKGAVIGANHERETCAERVCRTKQAAEIDRFGNALGSDAEIASAALGVRCHTPYLPYGTI